MKIKRASVMVIASVFMVCVFLATIALSQEVRPSEMAKQHVSQLQNIPEEQLKVVNEGYGNYPLSKQKIYSAKILDKQTGKTYGVFIDAYGNIVDINSVKAAEKAAYTQKYGKLEPELYNRLQAMGADEKIKVGIWLTSIDSRAIEQNVLSKHPSAKVLGNKPIGKNAEAIRSKMFIEKAKAYTEKEEPVINYLKGKGFEITYASIAAPLVFAELPKSVIQELEKRADVVSIYLTREYKPSIDTAVPTVQAPTVWAKGFDGSGVKVGVVEVNVKGGGSRIDFTNPFLAPINGGTFLPGNPESWHATEVAGVIASNHGVFRGVADDVKLLSANAANNSDPAIIAASEWALNNNADILSCSFENKSNRLIDNLAKYYDHVVFEHYRAVVVAAGNKGNNVKSPAVAYNVIAVGATDDMNTAAWPDDVMWGSSNWIDPISPFGDREKPEVSAVGARIRSTENATYNATKGSWITIPAEAFAGTSYAAPAVSGEIGLLIDMDPALSSWPETTKAIVMATAKHKTSDATTNIDNPAVDVKEGVGTIVASDAYTTVNNNWYSSDVVGAGDFPVKKTFNVNNGQHVRFAIAWSSHTDRDNNSAMDTLTADLDLYIYDPNDNLVVYSLSFDNSYEIVNFTAPVSGIYTAKIDDFRFDAAFEYLGTGWIKQGPLINLTNLGPEYQEILPGGTAPYTIRVTNLGSETDTIQLEHENISESGSCSWTVGLSKDSVTLDPDAHEDVTLSVTADSNCNISSRIKVKVTGTSKNGLNVGETITDSVIKETHVVPEFATIAIPVAAIIGLLFLFSRRRRKE